MDFTDEPPHSARLVVHGTQPFNAEPPLDALVQHEITPAELVYSRNHGAARLVRSAQRRVC
jgi:sulfite oxidase